MTSVETAKDLIAFAGGPSIVGVGAVLAYLARTLSDRKRDARKGWLALGAGFLLLVWLVLFVILAASTVLASWMARGNVEPTLVLLSATWLVAFGLMFILIRNAKVVAQYLVDSYPPDKDPWLVRLFRRRLGD